MKKVFNKKIKANGDYNEFLNSLPDEYIIEYNYEIEYITEEDTYKRTGTTMDKEELRNKIEKLIIEIFSNNSLLLKYINTIL